MRNNQSKGKVVPNGRFRPAQTPSRVPLTPILTRYDRLEADATMRQMAAAWVPFTVGKTPEERCSSNP